MIFEHKNALLFSSYKRILVIISHSQDFLNGVCTNIIHINKKRLKYYTGNYDAFVRTRMELLENQMKQYNWEQDQINHMKVKDHFNFYLKVSSVFYYRITLRDLDMDLLSWHDKHNLKRKLSQKWLHLV